MKERRDVMHREEAMAQVRKIHELSTELVQCGYRDLESRAAEINAMAMLMLYDLGEPR